MFWKRNLISEEKAAWVQTGFARLIRDMGPTRFLYETRLVLPTRTFFKTGSGKDHETAQAVFNEVRAHMGMRDWPCELVRRPGRLEAAAHDYNAISSVAGTYQQDGNSALITYDPDLLAHPVCFIATMAHELSHYILDGERSQDWYGPEAELENELMTDLCAIIYGFGVIQMLGARRIGWAGYLSNETRAYATALFCHLKGVSSAEVEPHLDGFLRKRYRRAVLQLEKEADAVQKLEALIDPE